jgi:opacity protein-like surface antigen
MKFASDGGWHFARRFHMHLKLVLLTLILAATYPMSSQVVPAAREGGLPIVVGVGFSNFYTDWSGRLSGPTIWADWNFYHGPSLLHGFGIEVQGRDLNYFRTGSVTKLRMDTASGGPIYTWRKYRTVHPYGKFLIGYGSIDFNAFPSLPFYQHESRTVYTPGGGAEVRLWRNVSLRGEYEYQFWHDLFGSGALNPQGLTIGASYDFRRSNRH